MKSWSDALSLILEKIPSLPGERLPLEKVRGRILYEAARASVDAPRFDLSMMDGFALGAEGHSGEVREIEGTTAAGDPPAHPLRPGVAHRVFTGAPVPEGTIRVIPQEDVDLLPDQRIRLRIIPDTPFLRLCGSEARAGDVLLPPGQRLGPAELAILATLGQSCPIVGGQPVVDHLVLGNELVASSQVPQPGQIRDSNSILIRSLIEEQGARLNFHRRLADDPQAILSALAETRSDLLLISGGASVGVHDHARSCLRDAGFTMLCEKIRLRPGQPTAIGWRENQTAICLPGNPVAHLVVFHLLVLPVLRKFVGVQNPAPVFYHGLLLADLPGRPHARPTFWPATYGPEGLCPLRFLSSGDLLALAGVNALLALPADQPLPKAGASVSYLPLHPYL